MRYRPEIDGLRAVAVVPVILFHAGFETFQGGFAGVDIFFVISGYLITSIVLKDLDRGTFSLRSFYERRARRILPALIVVLLTCLPFAWVWLTPRDLNNFMQSLVAVSTFSSNLYFWLVTDYFDTASELKPLLHTWSLAVEEQYYMIFPFAMVALWRFGIRRIAIILSIMLAASLAIAHWAVPTFPMAAFYLLPMRAWELLIGALAAIYLASRSAEHEPVRPVVAQLLSAIGVGLICYAIFAFDKGVGFPGLPALLPTVGACLVILFANEGTLVNLALRTKLLVGIGLISYSAYLWHQPVMAFVRYRSILPPGEVVMGLLCVLTLLLAFLSWRLVESPFRNRQRVTTRALATAGSALGVLMISVGLAGYLSKGFPQRFSPETLAVLETRPGDTSGCHNALTAAEIRNGRTCIVNPDFPTRVAIIGDSHASRITDATADELAKLGTGFATFSGSWCAPLLGLRTSHPMRNPDCHQEVTSAYQAVATNADIDFVVLFAQWSNYTEGNRQGARDRAIYGFDDQRGTSAASNPDFFEKALRASLRELVRNGKKVILVTSTPEFPMNVPNALFQMVQYDVPEPMKVLSVAEYEARNRIAETIFQETLPDFPVVVLEARGLFCDGGHCDLSTEDFRPLFEDDNHLSHSGSQRIARALHDLIAQEMRMGHSDVTPDISNDQTRF